jgi:hypothetical protein
LVAQKQRAIMVGTAAYHYVVPTPNSTPFLIPMSALLC